MHVCIYIYIYIYIYYDVRLFFCPWLYSTERFQEQ